MSALLDTNVISEPRKPRPDLRVQAFYMRTPLDHMFVSTVTLAELRFGIRLESSSVKRQTLDLWLEQSIRPFFLDRTLEVTEAVLLRWRVLLEAGRRAGRTFSQPDLFLAATALEHALTLVTRNTKDFAGIADLQLLNPWDPQP